MQAISGTYFILIAGSLFANRMLDTLRVSYPALNAGQVISTGASEIQHVFTGEDLAAVLDAYMVGIKAVFAFSLATCALTVLIALVIPFRRLHDHAAEKKESVELEPSV
jgi:hypothetical protein